MDWRNWKPLIDDDNKSLVEAREAMPVDSVKAPFLVWLIENPKSPISFPGWADIDIHDFMHLILGQDLSPEGEAFVIGFCMGNNRATKPLHVKLFKVLAKKYYPKYYRLTESHLVQYNIGFDYGRRTKYKNINESQFETFRNYSLAYTRRVLGLEKVDLRRYACR